MEPITQSLGPVIEFARDLRRRHSRDAPPVDFPFDFCPRTLSYDVHKTKGTFLWLHGTDAFSRTVAVRVCDFFPYFYVRVAPASCDERTALHRAQLLRGHLDAALTLGALALNGAGGSASRALGAGSGALVGVKVCRAIAVKSVDFDSRKDSGYRGDPLEWFAQLFVYCPSLVRLGRIYVQEASRREPVHHSRDAFLAWFRDALKYDEDAGADFLQPAPVKANARSHAECLRIAAAGSRLGSARKRSRDEPSPPPAAPDESLADADFDAVVDSDNNDNDNTSPTLPDFVIERNARICNEAWTRLCALAFLSPLAIVGDAAGATVFCADIDFTIRFAIDSDFSPEQWVRISQGIVVSPNCRDTCAVIELDVGPCVISRLDDDAQQDRVTPQCCLSFDIETALGANNAFPRPETERVLQIACVVFDPIADPSFEHASAVAFTYDAPEQGAAACVFSFDDERQLLEAFSVFVRTLQPDLLTGYNIEDFDIPYLLHRAEHLGIIKSFERMTRGNEWSRLRVSPRSVCSKGSGVVEFNEVSGTGLFVYDVLLALRRSKKPRHSFRSYTLEAVSRELLNESKNDLAYSLINDRQRTAAGRRELLDYCLQDAWLPARIIVRELMLSELIEEARVIGVPMLLLVRRGTTARLRSVFMRDCAPHSELLYTLNADDRRALAARGKHTGAIVIDPERGLHTRPVGTQDYKSLYPSIIEEINSCSTTKLPLAELDERVTALSLDRDRDVLMISDRETGAQIAAFVRVHVRLGMIPRIESRMLSWRAELKRIRKDYLAKAKQARERGDVVEERKWLELAALYDGRQLSAKLIANSTYGLTGGRAFLPDRDVAESITKTGQNIIMETRELIHRRYQRAQGFPFDAHVIYGDTDSVFVRLDPGPGPPPEPYSMDAIGELFEGMAAEINESFKVGMG